MDGMVRSKLQGTAVRGPCMRQHGCHCRLQGPGRAGRAQTTTAARALDGLQRLRLVPVGSGAARPGAPHAVRGLVRLPAGKERDWDQQVGPLEALRRCQSSRAAAAKLSVAPGVQLLQKRRTDLAGERRQLCCRAMRHQARKGGSYVRADEARYPIGAA